MKVITAEMYMGPSMGWVGSMIFIYRMVGLGWVGPSGWVEKFVPIYMGPNSHYPTLYISELQQCCACDTIALHGLLLSKYSRQSARLSVMSIVHLTDSELDMGNAQNPLHTLPRNFSIDGEAATCYALAIGKLV